MAAGRSSTRLTFCTPSEEPPEAGLTISGSPSRATIRSRTAPAPSSRKVLCGSATQSGVARPADRTTDLAAGLSQASRQKVGVGVAQLGVQTGAGQLLPDLRPRGEADLPLEGEATGQDDRAQRVR